MSTFSVLICTYNRPDMLALSLDAIINRTLEKPDQVVIVNGGDERSSALVESFISKTDVPIELIRTVNKNLAASRNIGLSHCTGEIVAMTDDDAEVFPDWITEMKKAHAEHPEAGCIGGAVVGADSEKSLLSRIADAATFHSPPEPGYVRTIAGVNVSYKGVVLKMVGSQDETLFRGEDVDFNWRVKQLGYEIYYSPLIKVLHHHRPGLRQFIQQFHMYGRAYYLVRSKWPEMYCIYPHRISKPKDVLRAINFVLKIFYQPILHAFHISPWYLSPLVYVVMLLSGIAWSYGVLLQKFQPSLPTS